MINWRARFVVAVALLALAAACGDDGGGTDADSAAGGTASGDSASAAPEGVDCVNLPGCPVEVSATEGLADGDLISVRVEGWDPNMAIGIGQCEDPADPDNADLTPQPDGLPPAEVCNVQDLTSAAQAETSDAEGTVVFDYDVRAGERMSQESVGGVCDAEHDCRLHVFLSGDVRLRSDSPRVSIPLTFA